MVRVVRLIVAAKNPCIVIAMHNYDIIFCFENNYFETLRIILNRDVKILSNLMILSCEPVDLWPFNQLLGRESVVFPHF